MFKSLCSGSSRSAASVAAMISLQIFGLLTSGSNSPTWGGSIAAVSTACLSKARTWHRIQSGQG